MKTFLISNFLIAMIATLALFTEKEGQLIDSSKVTYNIENKMLNGRYLIKDTKAQIRLQGSYKDNKRSGNWYCFNAEGKMVLRYNYDVKKLISLDDKAFDSVEVEILDKNPDVVSKASNPYPMCDIGQLKTILIEELKNDPKFKSEAGMIDANITVKINAEGKAQYYAKYTLNNVVYDTTIFLQDKLFTIEWFPSQYESRSYKSEFNFSARFQLLPSDHKRFIWNY